MTTFFTHVKIDNLEIQKRIKVTVKKYRWSAYNGDITLSNHVWMQCPPGTHPCIYYFFLGTNCVYFKFTPILSDTQTYQCRLKTENINQNLEALRVLNQLVVYIFGMLQINRASLVWLCPKVHPKQCAS